MDTDASEGADPQCSRLPGRAMGGVLHTATLATEESSRAVHDGGTGHDEAGGGQPGTESSVRRYSAAAVVVSRQFCQRPHLTCRA